MYIGFHGQHSEYSILCSKNEGSDCLAYEEAIRLAETENGEEMVKNRHWTNFKTWRINLNMIKRCPSNPQRGLIDLMSDKEQEIENEFFNGSPVPQT